SYDEAMESSDKDKWLQAIQAELKSQHDNGTWIVVKKTKSMKIITAKWVFDIKRDVNGNIVRYKARLVARGFDQEYGIDYEDTFAPVLKYKSLRLLLCLSLLHTLTTLLQYDVKTAFLNATIDECVYVEIPQGVNENNNTKALKLVKALYGIKQAPRAWNN